MLHPTTIVLVALICSQGAAAPTTPDSLKVVVLNAKPFSFLDVENAQSDEDAKYAGVLIDLFKDIANRLNYTYEFYQVPDAKYGYQDDTGQWHGLIRELLDRKADVAVAPLTITADRAKVVRFGRPLVTAGIIPIIKRPAAGQPLPFTTIAELISSDILYGAVKDGSTYQYFVNAPNGSVDAFIGQQMNARSDEVLARSYEEGVKRVREGGYVFFGEQYSLELLASRAPCNLMLVGDIPIAARHYAFAFRKEASELSDRFDQALIEQEWDVNKLTKKYWEPQCLKPQVCICAREARISSEMSEEIGGKKHAKPTPHEKNDDDSEEEEERKEDKAAHEQKTTEQTLQAVPTEQQPQTGDAGSDNKTQQIIQEIVTEDKDEKSEQPVESDSAAEQPASEQPAQHIDNLEPSVVSDPEPTAEDVTGTEETAQVEEKEQSAEATETADTAENEEPAAAEEHEPNAETAESEHATETTDPAENEEAAAAEENEPNAETEHATETTSATESANDDITAADSMNETTSGETTTTETS